MGKTKIKFNQKYVLGAIVTFFVVLVSFQNCAKLDIQDLDKTTTRAVSSIPTDEPPITTTPDPIKTVLNIEDSPGYVCSAFGTTTVPSDKSGLKAELRFLDQAAVTNASVKNGFASMEYFNDKNSNFVKKPETVFLNDVNVPTRDFSQGFQGSDGKSLVDTKGNKLFEYFGLRMETVLKLAADEPAGYYELSLVSDDGSLLEVKQNDKWVTLIDNDGTHPTRMGCNGDGKIYFDKSTRLPIRITYHQGPAIQIANVLIWNYRGPDKQTSSSVASDKAIHTHCGDAATAPKYDGYWSSANGSVGPWGKDLTAQNWKILAPANFQLPDNEVNPCAYSTYDVAPVLTYTDISDTNKLVTVESSDSTVLTANLYLVNQDGTKDLVVTRTSSEDTKHSFETGSILTTQKYILEVIFEIPAKKVKVLKSYNLSFTP